MIHIDHNLGNPNDFTCTKNMFFYNGFHEWINNHFTRK